MTEAAADVTRPAAEEAPKSSAKNALEWVAVLAGALLVALLVKTFILAAYYIPSGSMLPTLGIGDRVLVSKLSYNFGDIDRGDLVVFGRPAGEPAGRIPDLIKRVVGLGGETIEGRRGTVLIDGEAIAEDYLPEGTANRDFGPFVIGDDEVFVMGDNRGDSRDSTVFGPIDQDLIVGRAFIRIWPFTEFGLL